MMPSLVKMSLRILFQDMVAFFYGDTMPAIQSAAHPGPDDALLCGTELDCVSNLFMFVADPAMNPTTEMHWHVHEFRTILGFETLVPD